MNAQEVEEEEEEEEEPLSDTVLIYHGQNPDSDDEQLADSDGENEGFCATRNLRGAADLLENVRGPPICELDVVASGEPTDDEEEGGDHHHHHDNNDEEEDGRRGFDAAQEFRRFVHWLGMTNGRTVRRLALIWSIWEDGRPRRRPHEDDINRLCRDVLPNHPTLRHIGAEMPTQYVQVLVSSLPNHRDDDTANSIRRLGQRQSQSQSRRRSQLRTLFIRSRPDYSTAEAIAAMLLRNTSLTHLCVSPSPRCGGPTVIDTDACQVICRAASRAASVRHLYVEVDDARGDTLDDIMASTSPLQTLTVRANRFSPQCVANVTRQLRTNTNLVRIRLLVCYENHPPQNDRTSPFLAAMVDVIRTYNVTLRTVTLDRAVPFRLAHAQMDRIVASCIQRNRRIRCAIRQLQPRNYHITKPSWWPHVFGMVSDVPTILYRFVRRGNVNEFCDAVLRRSRFPPPPPPPTTSSATTATRGRKRKRRRRHRRRGQEAL